MPDFRVSQVPIHARDAAEVSLARRWECCRISLDVARELNIPLGRDAVDGGFYRVRICVTDADVNLLFNPSYVEYLGKCESFVVEGLTGGSHRVEIYANSGPGAKDGGVFKLYGGDNPFAGARLPTNARVTLCREAAPERRACGSELRPNPSFAEV